MKKINVKSRKVMYGFIQLISIMLGSREIKAHDPASTAGVEFTPGVSAKAVPTNVKIRPLKNVST